MNVLVTTGGQNPMHQCTASQKIGARFGFNMPKIVLLNFLFAHIDDFFVNILVLILCYLSLLEEGATASYLALPVVIHSPVCIQHCITQSASMVHI